MALDLNDKTSNGNNLTNVNTVADSNTVPFAGYNTDSALFTASSSMKLETGTSPTNLNIGASFSIEAWIKPTQLTGGTPYTVCAKFDSSGQYSFIFQTNRNTTGELSFLYTTDGSSITSFTDSTTALSDTNYHHVACTYDGTTFRWYIDTVASGTTTASVTVFASTSRVCIGARGDNTEYFNGNIDEVRMWSSVRSASQISANWKKQLNGNESGLIGYWPFNAAGNPSGGFFAAAR